MRTARMKMVGGSCYYHVMNRLAGPKDWYPLTDVDREIGMNMICELSNYFLLEFVSMCWMGNHFHIVLYAPSERELPDNETIAARHNAFRSKSKYINPEDDVACLAAGLEMIDISEFMKVFQQKFSFYYNRAYNRRGSLWADRFKSTILDGEQSLWSAVKYVELNPVRAKLVDDPADYRHSTWGWFCGSGKHLFESTFLKHMRRSLGEIAADWTMDEVCALFRSELARIMATEAGKTMEEVHEAASMARKNESMPIRYLRRTRHWTDGGIIGTKAFVQEVACQFREAGHVAKRQFSRGKTTSGVHLYCFKRLRRIT